MALFDKLAAAATMEGKAFQHKNPGREKLDEGNADGANIAWVALAAKDDDSSLDLGAGSDVFVFGGYSTTDELTVDMGSETADTGYALMNKDKDTVILKNDITNYDITNYDIADNGNNTLTIKDRDSGTVITFEDVEFIKAGGKRFDLRTVDGVVDLVTATTNGINWAHNNNVNSRYMQSHMEDRGGELDLGAGADVFYMGDRVVDGGVINLGANDGDTDRVILKNTINDYDIDISGLTGMVTFTQKYSGSSVAFEGIGSEDVFTFANAVEADAKNYTNDTFTWSELMTSPKIVEIADILSAFTDLEDFHNVANLDIEMAWA